MPLFLEAEVDSVCLEVSVNGIPLQRFIAGGVTKHYQPINELILPGANIVRLELQSEGGTPRHPWRAGDVPAAAAAAGARVVLYRDGETPGQDEGEELTRFVWRQEETPIAALPGALEFGFDLPEDYPRPAWADGDLLPDEDAGAVEAWNVVRAVHGFLTRGDVPRLMTAARPLHTTLALAYGEDPAEKAAKELAWWTDFLPTMPPLAPLATVPDEGLRLIAGGRLWEALAEDWRSAIRGAAPGFGYTLCLGKLAGRWRILL